MSEYRPAFQIAAFSIWSGNLWFNVFVEGRELYFINTTKPCASVGETVAKNAGILFGPLGILISLGADSMRRKRRERLAQQPEPPSPHPGELLVQYRHNHRVHVSEIEECRIMPQRTFTLMNEHIAYMTFRSLGRKRSTLLFEAADQLECAISTLRPLLGPRLEITL